MNNKTTFDISAATILKIVGVLLGLWFLWYIKDILILLFVVAILVAAFSPIVERLHKEKVPRVLSVLMIYLVFGGFVSLLLYLIVPTVIIQIQQLAAFLPNFIQKYTPLYYQLVDYLPILQRNLEGIVSIFNKYGGNLWLLVMHLFGGLISFFTILVLTLYFLVGREQVKNAAVSFLAAQHQEKLLRVASKIGSKMGAWFRGQFILSLLIGVATYIVLSILNIPYALVLAVLAGILEIIPTFGPIIAAVPAILLGLTVSPWIALITVLAYFGIQQFEAQLVVPKLMGKMVGLSPIIIIIALLIGGKLLGVTGAILAIPAAAAISVLIKEIKPG